MFMLCPQKVHFHSISTLTKLNTQNKLEYCVKDMQWTSASVLRRKVSDRKCYKFRKIANTNEQELLIESEWRCGYNNDLLRTTKTYIK